MDIASPSGGYVPIDPESLMLQEVGHLARHGWQGPQALRGQGLHEPAGGHHERGRRRSFDLRRHLHDGRSRRLLRLPQERGLGEVDRQFYESGKIVSAVCHGPAGLLEVKLSGGEFLIEGKDLTGFSWKEEELAKREEAVPYSLEEELKKRGAKYSKSSLPFKSYVVEDGLLITGQNPASAGAVGEAVVKRLKGCGITGGNEPLHEGGSSVPTNRAKDHRNERMGTRITRIVSTRSWGLSSSSSSVTGRFPISPYSSISQEAKACDPRIPDRQARRCQHRRIASPRPLPEPPIGGHGGVSEEQVMDDGANHLLGSWRWTGGMIPSAGSHPR